MERNRHIKIGELAQISGLTIRTLRYYEDIDLLVPGRSTKGYRLYSPEDLIRLQQILIQKSLGLPLERIKAALNNPGYDYLSTLQKQRQQLESQIAQNKERIRSIDMTVAEIKEKEANMPRKALFSGFDPNEFSNETRNRWGDTSAFEESHKRTSLYTDQNWSDMKEELDQIWKNAAQLLAIGELPSGEAAGTIAEQHRDHIERWFYPCSPAMHAGLAEMWLADPRFRKNIDSHGTGLTNWVTAAIKGLV